MTTTEQPTKTVGGLPVHGEISYYGGEDKLPTQKPIEDFVAVLDLLYAVGAESVRWQQYTPYFNDGEPCNFSTHEFYVRFPDSAEDAGDYEDGYEASYEFDERHPIAYTVFKEHLGYPNVKAFQNALLSAFGDPAEVTATREGFNVEFYDHD